MPETTKIELGVWNKDKDTMSIDCSFMGHYNEPNLHIDLMPFIGDPTPVLLPPFFVLLFVFLACVCVCSVCVCVCFPCVLYKKNKFFVSVCQYCVVFCCVMWKKCSKIFKSNLSMCFFFIPFFCLHVGCVKLLAECVLFFSNV